MPSSTRRLTHRTRWLALALLVAAAIVGRVRPGDDALAQPTPVDTLPGQRVTTCFGAERFAVSVVSWAGWQRLAGGTTAAGNALWAILLVDVTNTGPAVAIGGNASSAVSLLDERGRQFKGSSDVAFLTAVADEFDSQQPYISIPAGVTEPVVFVFPVAPDAAQLTLTADPFQCMLASAAPAPLTPADTLLGQRVTTCFGSERFAVSVVRTGWQRSAGGTTAVGDAFWAVVVVDVTNTGTAVAIGGNASSAVKLVDERDRQFKGSADVAFLTAVAEEFDSQQPYITIPAGVTEPVVFVFPVAPDAVRLTLTADPFQCSL